MFEPKLRTKDKRHLKQINLVFNRRHTEIRFALRRMMLRWGRWDWFRCVVCVCVSFLRERGADRQRTVVVVVVVLI